MLISLVGPLAGPLVLVAMLVGAKAPAPAPQPSSASPPAQHCDTLAFVRAHFAAGVAERALLQGERAATLLAAIGRRGSAALVVTMAQYPDQLAILAFDASGCTTGAVRLPAVAVAQFLDPAT
jgi:hypothetical protein